MFCRRVSFHWEYFTVTVTWTFSSLRSSIASSVRMHSCLRVHLSQEIMHHIAMAAQCSAGHKILSKCVKEASSFPAMSRSTSCMDYQSVWPLTSAPSPNYGSFVPGLIEAGRRDNGYGWVWGRLGYEVQGQGKKPGLVSAHTTSKLSQWAVHSCCSMKGRQRWLLRGINSTS